MQSLGEFIGQNAWIVVVVLLLIVAGLFVWWRQKAKSKPPAEPDFTDLTPQEVAESIPATSLEIEPDYEPEDSYQREATEQETGLESGLETEPDYDYDLPAEASPASSIADDETEPAAVGQEIELEDAVVVAEEATPAEEAVEIPESVPSRLQRLRGRLSKSGGFGRTVLQLLSRGDLSARDWEEIEETLLLADLGMDVTTELMDKLRLQAKVLGTKDPTVISEVLRKELLLIADGGMDRSLHMDSSLDPEGGRLPATMLVVGVNGTGKTTTIGKLARILVAEGKTVLLGAADTFRAAAAEQLTTWGQRSGVEVVRSAKAEGGDPGAVAFDAVKAGIEQGTDVVIVDTAGRLQNKTDLMDELGKVKRIMERNHPISEVLLVLDATVGQNGLRQALVFSEVVAVTGIVLTKLDGTAKGGIVLSVQRELGVPVKLVGLGEGPDDLAPFDPAAFVDALIPS